MWHLMHSHLYLVHDLVWTDKNSEIPAAVVDQVVYQCFYSTYHSATHKQQLSRVDVMYQKSN